MTDVYDLLVERTRELSGVRFELEATRVWLRASLDALHDQRQQIERQQRQNLELREEFRQFREQIALLSVGESEAA
jgi:hypothetical protein